MNRLVKHITTLFGLALIPYAAYSHYTLEKVTGGDFLWIIVAAGILIYIKSEGAKALLNKVVDKKISK